MDQGDPNNTDQVERDNGGSISESKSISSETSFDSPDQFLDRLRKALQKDGDFPASARVVNELKALVSDPKTSSNQIAELILREPSLGVRVLHLVNSTFYRRAKPIMTVSQAVIQIGMKPLAEMCAGLVLLQKFVPVARRGGVFASSLQQIVMTSLLTSSLSEARSRLDSQATAIVHATGKGGESGYLAGSLRELGQLLLAYYFPKAYEAAAKRSEQKKVSLAQGVQEITGLSPAQLSIEVIQALDLPEIYRLIIEASESGSTAAFGNVIPTQQKELGRIATSLGAANKISETIAAGKSKERLDAVIKECQSTLGIEMKEISTILGALPEAFKDQCSTIDLPLSGLPEYLGDYGKSEVVDTSSSAPGSSKSSEADAFAQFVDEIRASVESREPTASIITSVMETLAWGMGFDRVVLLLVGAGKKSMTGRMSLGDFGDFDPKTVVRNIVNSPSSTAPELNAFLEGRTIFNGNPVLKDGWPLAAIPVGFGTRCIGVIYADCIESKPRKPNCQITDELNQRQQAAIGVLAELLDRSVREGG